MPRPTVLIVDDHEGFRASARALLQAGGFDVIGEAAGGMEAIEAVSTLRPEIVVLAATHATTPTPTPAKFPRNQAKPGFSRIGARAGAW